MKTRSVVMGITLVFHMISAHAEMPSPPSGFTDAMTSRGDSYRIAVAAVLQGTNVVARLEGILKHGPVESDAARQARILLARIKQPEVFPEFDIEIQRWREGESSGYPRGGRPGFLSGLLTQSVLKRGPENKYIEVNDGWEPLSGGSNQTSAIIMRRMVYKKIDKYTEAEVSAGIARNAAARQAVLEHFLKFLDEGDAYEQSEIVELVNRLWGQDWPKRTGDLATIDHVHDVNSLIEGVFRNQFHHPVVRMYALSYLPEANPVEVCALMLNLVTNTPPNERYFHVESLVDKALHGLESSADTNALAILKNQTNGPAWKCEAIKRTVQIIEDRLSKTMESK